MKILLTLVALITLAGCGTTTVESLASCTYERDSFAGINYNSVLTCQDVAE